MNKKMFDPRLILLVMMLACSVGHAADDPLDQYLAQAKGYYSAQNYRDMQNTLLAAVQDYPDSPELYYNLGIAYTKLERPKLAVRSFEKALKLRPGFKEARMSLASLYLDSGQNAQALAQFQQLLKIDKDNPELAEKLGILYYNQKNFKEAARSFSRAVEIDPQAAVGVNNYLGMSYFMLGEKDQARAALGKAQAAHVITDEGKRLAALLALDAQQDEQAITLISELVRDGKATADDLNNLGTAYSRGEDLESAVGAYQKALSLEPKHLTALKNIAIAYGRLEEYAQAALVWKRYTVLRPEDADAFYNLGVALEGEEKFSDALVAYQKAKDLGYLDTERVDKAITYMQSKQAPETETND